MNFVNLRAAHIVAPASTALRPARRLLFLFFSNCFFFGPGWFFLCGLFSFLWFPLYSLVVFWTLWLLFPMVTGRFLNLRAVHSVARASTHTPTRRPLCLILLFFVPLRPAPALCPCQVRQMLYLELCLSSFPCFCEQSNKYVGVPFDALFWCCADALFVLRAAARAGVGGAWRWGGGSPLPPKTTFQTNAAIWIVSVLCSLFLRAPLQDYLPKQMM